MDRFAYVVLLRTYTTALTRGNVLGADSLAVRVRTLQLAFQVHLDARRQIDTLDPRKIGAKEIGVLAQWMAEKSVGYQAKLWTAVEAFLLFCKNTILADLEAQKLWKRPRPTYMPKGVKPDVLSYWAPDKNGVVQNDFLCIGRRTKSPALAHAFLDFLLDEKNAYDNFVQQNGYSPPQKQIDADLLIKQGLIPKTLTGAVTRPDQFAFNQELLQLSVRGERLWDDAWSKFKAG